MRKQKPLSLGSTSIFDIEEAQTARESSAAFRFIPEIGSPEEPWLRWVAAHYPKPGLNTNVFPVALLDLNAWGAPQAGNFILDSSWAMDENMPKTVSELKRWVLRRALAGQVQPVDCRIWNLLSPSWRLLPEGIQAALRGEMWANRRLETAFSAWLDSKTTIAPLHYPNLRTSSNQTLSGAAFSAEFGIEDKLPDAQSKTEASKAGNPSMKSSASAALNATAPQAAPERKVKAVAARRAARGHFLDPCPDFYERLLADTIRIDKDLTALGFPLDPNLKRGLDDYNRLFQRFLKISRDEIEGKPLLIQDLSLLSNIDLILEKIDLPLPAVISFAAQVAPNKDLNNASKKGGTVSEKGPEQGGDLNAGYSMALGRPGLLYIILMNKNTKEWTLARGAVYTYYEQYGSALTEEQLLQKIDQGSIQSPYWTERFDLLQAEKK
ncbi:MAG: DUF3160 domain-containing protein [Candidatus Obscuribacterales bacterium]|nr:DUF3160 domain-containing protein [Candidatus Obscuribacterales bacterium]